jgi:hypothetical protein
MEIAWSAQGSHQEASVTMAGLFTAKLVVARDGSWSLLGPDGRKTTGGKAMSVGHAKQAALTALKEVLEACVHELGAALKTG